MDQLQQLYAQTDEILKKFKINLKISTNAIHTGHISKEHDATGRPVIPPISLSTTFVQEEPNNPLKYDYSRAGNYNRECLEKTIAAMDNGKYCTAFSSGLAAISSITNYFNPGDHVIFFNDVYGGTGRYYAKVAMKFGINCEAIDLQDLASFKKVLKPNTRMVWIETPSNPMMKIVDIEEIVKISKAHDKNIIVAVDSTFLTPVFQQALNNGADISMHSLTKYMNGHSDVLMGAIVTNNKTIHDFLVQQQLMVGAVPSPFDCYMALRGLRTLVVRMKQHQHSALVIALYLKNHPKVEKVLHPALFADQSVIKKQMNGFSGMISFYIKGNKESASKFIKKLRFFQLAESLGGFESLIEIPSLMTHASVPEERRNLLGISDNMIRMSVGLEDLEDLIQDIEQALNSI